MENNKASPEIKPLYQKIFGVPRDSFSGPLFFFIMGIICLIIGISINGTFTPGVLGDYPSNSARPDITFPFVNMITLFFIGAGIVGFFLGSLGIIWYWVFPSNNS